MQTLLPKIVEKSLVHKIKEENILIKNIRAEIPQFIPKFLFENDILGSLSEEDRSFMKDQFLPIDLTEKNLPFLDGTGEYVHFKSIKPILSLEYFNNKKESLNQLQIDQLLEFYAFDSVNNCFILTKPIKEMQQLSILNILNEKELYLTDTEKAHLSDMLQNIEGLENEDTFYTNMYVDTNHEFFFEHYNDHVPGMMIIEALRQFGVACGHKYGKIPIEGYQIMMSDLEIQFSSYVEFQFPIKMVGTVIQKQCTSTGLWRKMTLEFRIYQHSMETARFKFAGRSYKKDIFNRLREKQKEMVKKYRFQVFDYNKHNHKFCLKNQQTHEYINARLNNISFQGFNLGISKYDLNEPESTYDFYFSFENLYFIHGQCETVWFEESGVEYTIGFRITDITAEDSENLIKSIERFTRVIEYRELF